MAVASLSEHSRPETAAAVRSAGEYLRSSLRAVSSPWIGDIRGVGLLVGLELVDAGGQPDAAAVGRCVLGALREGVLLLGGGRHGNVVSLAPPFSLRTEETDFLASRLAAWIERA
jgi:4-aminobutyrate aminotransferase